MLRQNDEEVITQDVDTETTENTEETEDEQDDVEELKKKLATAEAQKEHWRKKANEPKETKEAVVTTGLSIADTLYLAKADIHEEDISDVMTYAEKMGVSVKEAHAFYKPILSERQETRRTALATQTGGGNRGTKGASPEALLQKAASGEVSEDEIEKLAQARMEQRTKR